MFYRKNVGTAEGLFRGLMGVGLIGAGLLWQGDTPMGIGLALVGATGILTGMLGYCPACAMMGRRPLP